MRKRLVMLALLLGLFALPLATSGGTVSAERGGARGTVTLCQEREGSGVNDAAGATLGECVTNFNDLPSENANSHFAGHCGAEGIRFITETTNKGDCIQYFRPSS